MLWSPGIKVGDGSEGKSSTRTIRKDRVSLSSQEDRGSGIANTANTFLLTAGTYIWECC